jgi:hypothetical protein
VYECSTSYLQDPQCASTLHHTCRIYTVRDYSKPYLQDSGYEYSTTACPQGAVRASTSISAGFTMCKYPQDTAFKYSTPYA